MASSARLKSLREPQGSSLGCQLQISPFEISISHLHSGGSWISHKRSVTPAPWRAAAPPQLKLGHDLRDTALHLGIEDSFESSYGGLLSFTVCPVLTVNLNPSSRLLRQESQQLHNSSTYHCPILFKCCSYCGRPAYPSSPYSTTFENPSFTGRGLASHHLPSATWTSLPSD